jgi:hypothetical protein
MSSTLPNTIKFLYIQGEVAQESAVQRRYNVFPIHTMYDTDTVLLHLLKTRFITLQFRQKNH